MRTWDGAAAVIKYGLGCWDGMGLGDWDGPGNHLAGHEEGGEREQVGEATGACYKQRVGRQKARTNALPPPHPSDRDVAV